MKNDLIIFDCDGVLVDSESITNNVLANSLNKHGTNLTGAEAFNLFKGGALADCIKYVKEKYQITLPDSFTVNFRHQMKLAFEKELKPVPGVVELLETLSNRKICVASNGPVEKINTTLRITGLTKYFKNNIFSAYQIKKWKPDPSLFLHAAKEMGTPPSSCVVIEDSHRGVEAATAAGMKSYAYGAYGDEQKLKDAGGTVFHEMSFLKNLI